MLRLKLKRLSSGFQLWIQTQSVFSEEFGMLFQQLRRNYTWEHVKAKHYICKELKYRITDTEVVSVWNIESQVFKHNIKQNLSAVAELNAQILPLGNLCTSQNSSLLIAINQRLSYQAEAISLFPEWVYIINKKNASVAFDRPNGSPPYCIFPFIYLCCRNSLNYSSWTKCLLYLKRLRLSKLENIEKKEWKIFMPARSC